MGFDVVVFADADIVDGGYPGAPEWIARVVELEIMLDGESVAWAEWEDNPDAATPNEAIRDAESIAMAINRELNTGFDLAAHDFESIGQWIHSAIDDCIYWSTGLRDFEFGLYDAAFIGLASRNAGCGKGRNAMRKKSDAFEDWRDNLYTDTMDTDTPKVTDSWVADPYMPDLLIRNYGDDWWGSIIADFDGWHWELKDWNLRVVTNRGVVRSLSDAKRACDNAAKIISPYVAAASAFGGTLLTLDVYDEPADIDGSYASIYCDGEWLRNFSDYDAAVGWLDANGYRKAYPEQEGDWSDPVNRLMAGPDTVGVYERMEVGASAKTASTFELARKMFVSLVKMDYPYVEYAIQNDGYTVEMLDAWDDEGAIAAFLEKYPDAYVYDEPKDISNKWASRKVAQDEEPVSEDPEEAFADLVDKLRETSFENLGDELEDIIDDPKLYALLSEGFGNGELTSVTMSTSAEAIPVQRLIPLQREIGLDNSLSYPLSGDPSYCFNPPVTVVAPIVTYNGTFIVDGHHRWSQVYMMNPDASINAINFNYGDQNPLRILRNFQGAIAVAEGEVPSQVVGVADVYSMGEDQIRSYIEDNIGQTCVDIVCNEVGLDSEDEVVEYILGNVMDLKQYAIPYGDAPARKDMPQTTEDAIDIAEDGQTNI